MLATASQSGWCAARNHVGVSVPSQVAGLWVEQIVDGRFENRGHFELVG